MKTLGKKNILIADVGHIRFYILYFDGGCRPYWTRWSRKPNTKKTRIISVGLSCYNMEINNLFVLLIYQVPEILHLMSFHDLRTTAILDVDQKPENNHIRGFAMQHFVEYDSSIVLLSHLTPAILLFMFFLNCGRAPS